MPAPSKRRITSPNPPAALPLWMLYPVFFTAVYLSHITLLRLPYFWDEAGYYVPAAWDFYRTGTLIPVTTASNAHPPLPSILLAGWWHLSGFVPSGTRTFICMVSAAALLAVFRTARNLLGTPAAAATTLLTALYPIWFAQSTLAHADIFAACFTLWGLSYYLEPLIPSAARPIAPLATAPADPAPQNASRTRVLAAILFSLAALSKETAIIVPLALAAWEGVLLLRDGRASHSHPPAQDAQPTSNREYPEDPQNPPPRSRLNWIAALLVPALPLAAWYAYHFHRTGFIFGNPEFLRYNATANLDPQRIALSLYHRLLHLTLHMDLFVPVLCALAALLLPPIAGRTRLPRPVLRAIVVVLFANWIAFSILGGALLTRYLLPMYPLVLLLCIAEWRLHLRNWGWLAALTAAAFLAGLWISPPYAFAPEDNLTYRDFIVLHQRAIALIAQRWPQATVLTAWPATSELERPELGYTKQPIRAYAIPNFAADEIAKAAADPGAYDTALLFSTKLVPTRTLFGFARGKPPAASDLRYFDFHQDLRPAQAAALLHGDIVWQAHNRDGGEWVAVLRFPRIEDASFNLR